MLPEIGASELIVIAAVALIVVGPKDLPLLLRKVGRFMAKMRGMAAEFRASFDEMARQSELDELRKEVEALRQGSFAHPIAGDLDQTVRDIDADLRAEPMLPLSTTTTTTPDPVEPELPLGPPVEAKA